MDTVGDGLRESGRLPRREFLRSVGLFVSSGIVAGLLQACGSAQAPPNPPTQAPPKPTQAPPKPTEAAPQATAAPAAQPAAPATQAPAVAKPTPPASGQAPAAAAPKRGGTLIVGTATETPGLDPHKLNVLPRSRVTQNMYGYLVQADKDMRIQPDLAERWEIAPDGKAYTFFLRKGVQFHTGRELTSADVKYTIDRILDPSYASFGRTLMDSIDGVETPDPYTARIVLKNPDAAILASLASSWGGIVAKEEVEKAGGELSKSEAGSGPFMLDEWIPNQTLKLRRNPNYYIKDQPYLDGVTSRSFRRSPRSSLNFEVGASTSPSSRTTRTSRSSKTSQPSTRSDLAVWASTTSTSTTRRRHSTGSKYGKPSRTRSIGGKCSRSQRRASGL